MSEGDASSPVLLIVDDDEVFRSRLAKAFSARGYLVLQAADVGEVAPAILDQPPRYAVVDLRLPSGSGLEVVRMLRQLGPSISIVVLTGYGSIASAMDAVALGATHYLTKPAGVDDILAGFERAAGALETPATLEHKAPSLARVEWEHINRVLADTGGNISQAAKRLGMHRRSLQRKLAKRPDKS